VVKFSSFYADVNRENPSGMSDADKTTLAASIFAGVLKHNFGYLHCWEIMKDEPKWQDRKARAFAKSAGCDGSGEDTINLVNDNYSPTGSAENANASAQNDEEDAEERPVSAAPTGKEKRTKVVSRTKLSNFIPEEDVNIVKSWLEIRCDPIISTGQKKDRMWLRILERYNFRRGSCPERSVRSLQCRWDTIKAQVGEFSSFYVDVNRENPTGMSDADKTTHAASNFAGVLKRNFGYLHCWEIMKDEPKWQDRKARAFAKSAGGDGFGEDTINLVNDNSSPIGSAENANASAQNDEEDAEERPVSAASTGKEKRTKVVSRTKLSNFIPEEDVNIVKSWLEISCDPITSTGQKNDGMWLRILERYNLRRGSCPERSVRSLQSRWDTIKAQVGKFSSFYADVNRENPSGMSDADKTTHAASIFAGVLKHNFGYLHCWEIMKDEPKWQDRKARAFAKSAGGDGFGEDTINLVNDNSSPTGSAEKRPMGRDSSKAAKKKANSSAGSASSSEYASRMQDLSSQKISILQEESVRKNDHFQQLACIDEKRFEAMRSYNQSLLLIEQEKIQLMREKHDMDKAEKEKKEDERILGIDLDACTSAQRVYYETLQEEILEKIAARRRKRRGP